MVTRLSGGLTPGDGADPRTFPTIWNDAAGTIESQGSAIAGLEGDSIPTDVSSPVAGDSLVYDGSNWVNGPRSGNAVINGGFGVWQRGTSFSGVNVYTADRWLTRFADGTLTTTRQGFSPADIEAIGYGDGEYFARLAVTGASSNNTNRLVQRIEDVRTLAGQTVTLSFWAKGDSAFDVRALVQQEFGSGGSSTVIPLSEATAITTSWARYSFTFAMTSLSGKTIGSDSLVEISLTQTSSLAAYTLDLWGVQLEASPVATPFKPAGGGSKAAELALCQRYYFKFSSGGSNYTPYGPAFGRQNSNVQGMVSVPVEMRVPPTALETTGTASDYRVLYQNANEVCTSVPTFTSAGTLSSRLIFSGSSVFTVGEGAMMVSNFSSSTSFLAWSAEL